MISWVLIIAILPLLRRWLKVDLTGAALPLVSCSCVSWPLRWTPPTLAGAHFSKLQDTETSLFFIWYRWKVWIWTWRYNLSSSPVRRSQIFTSVLAFFYLLFVKNFSLFSRGLDVAGSELDVCLAPIKLCNWFNYATDYQLLAAISFTSFVLLLYE